MPISNDQTPLKVIFIDKNDPTNFIYQNINQNKL